MTRLNCIAEKYIEALTIQEKSEDYINLCVEDLITRNKYETIQDLYSYDKPTRHIIAERLGVTMDKLNIAYDFFIVSLNDSASESLDF